MKPEIINFSNFMISKMFSFVLGPLHINTQKGEVKRKKNTANNSILPLLFVVKAKLTNSFFKNKNKASIFKKYIDVCNITLLEQSFPAEDNLNTNSRDVSKTKQ